MRYEEIKLCLEALAEAEYQSFSQSLVPGSRPMLGVRIPALRRLAKQIAKEDWQGFLDRAKEETSEEVNLQGFVIGYAKADYDALLPYITRHVEKIDDWFLCDGFCATLKIVKKHKEAFLKFLMPYVESNEEFKQRFAAVMLMNYYLEDEDIRNTLMLLDSMKHPGYYRQMAVAWAVATAWAKQREATACYMQPGNNTLDDFTYNKAIQKMLESYRVSAEDKQMLREMKRK